MFRLITPSTDAELRLRVFDSLADAESTWRALEAHGDLPSAYQLHDWLAGWHAHIGGPRGTRARIVLVEDAHGAPLMLLPLGIRREGVSRVLRWLGGSISGYHGPILAPDCPDVLLGDGFAALWSAVVAKLGGFDVAHLDRQPPTIGARRNPFHHLGAPLTNFSSPVALVGDDWASFYAGRFSSRSRGKWRRKRARLADHGPVAFQVARDPHEADAIIDALVQQKSQWLRAQGLHDLFARPHHEAFLRAMARAHPGLVQVSALRVGDAIAATHWGIVHHDTLHYWFQSHAEGDLARHSPAEILIRDLMRWCASNGVPRFDFGIGDHPYKLRWADQLVPLHDALLPRTVAGWVHQEAQRTERRLRDRIKSSDRLYTKARLLRARLFGRQSDT